MKKTIFFLLLFVPVLLFTLNGFGQAMMFQKVLRFNASSVDAGSEVLPTNDGGYLMIGKDGNLSTLGITLIKFNSQFDTIWTKVYSNL